MSGASPQSRALTWAFAILIGAPLLYFLSVPWVAIGVVHFHLETSLPVRVYLKPAQAMAYCRPWHRLYDPYANWCSDTAGLSP